MIRTIVIIACLSASLSCGGSSKPPGASVTTPGASPRYQIVLTRPFSAGDRLRVVVAARQQVTATEDAGERERSTGVGVDKDIDLSLTGVLTIREVDPEGRAKVAELDVEQFKEGRPGQDVVAPDTKIQAVRKGDVYALKVNGQARPDLHRFLELAFPLQRTGDELLGTKEPRQIGDTWAFTRSKVTESAIEEGYAVRETNVTGETRLLGTRLVGGVECLELASKVHADRATLGEIPELQGAGAGTFDATIAMIVPVDTKLPLAVEESNTRLGADAQLQGEDGTRNIRLTITRYRKANYTPMPASNRP